jgi:hypothetical protein
MKFDIKVINIGLSNKLMFTSNCFTITWYIKICMPYCHPFKKNACHRFSQKENVCIEFISCWAPFSIKNQNLFLKVNASTH